MKQHCPIDDRAEITLKKLLSHLENKILTSNTNREILDVLSRHLRWGIFHALELRTMIRRNSETNVLTMEQPNILSSGLNDSILLRPNYKAQIAKRKSEVSAFKSQTASSSEKAAAINELYNSVIAEICQKSKFYDRDDVIAWFTNNGELLHSDVEHIEKEQWSISVDDEIIDCDIDINEDMVAGLCYALTAIDNNVHILSNITNSPLQFQNIAQNLEKYDNISSTVEHYIIHIYSKESNNYVEKHFKNTEFIQGVLLGVDLLGLDNDGENIIWKDLVLQNKEGITKLTINDI